MGSTRLLISVRNPAEALAALENGADWIDVKEPLRGPLGMAEPRVIEAIVAAVAERAPVSAALGELTEQPDATRLPAGISHAKLGLQSAGLRPWQQQLAMTFAKVPRIAAVAVAYAGTMRKGDVPTPAPREVLQWAIDHRAAGILLDTHQKSSGNLLDFCDVAWLRSFIDRAHAARLFVALAGSLRGAALTTALTLKPDLIAVRGAACIAEQRLQPIDPKRVRQLASIIAAHNAATAGPTHRRSPASVSRGEG